MPWQKHLGFYLAKLWGSALGPGGYANGGSAVWTMRIWKWHDRWWEFHKQLHWALDAGFLPLASFLKNTFGGVHLEFIFKIKTAVIWRIRWNSFFIRCICSLLCWTWFKKAHFSVFFQLKILHIGRAPLISNNHTSNNWSESSSHCYNMNAHEEVSHRRLIPFNYNRIKHLTRKVMALFVAGSQYSTHLFPLNRADKNVWQMFPSSAYTLELLLEVLRWKVSTIIIIW